MSGVDVKLEEDDAFGDTILSFMRVGSDNAGTISFSGNYDPDDTNGQVSLNGLYATTIGFTNLYFYDQYGAGQAGATYSFWRVASGGSIFLTKFKDFGIQKNGIGKTSFTAQVSGAVMEWVS
ncbi:MAG: hypothetical protein GWN62_06995 [Aliifodinibius sp.]|nr:hypothetical protein [Fodinibius sp.]